MEKRSILPNTSERSEKDKAYPWICQLVLSSDLSKSISGREAVGVEKATVISLCTLLVGGYSTCFQSGRTIIL